MNDTEADLTLSTLQQILATLQAMRDGIDEIAAFVAETRSRRDDAEHLQADADSARQAQQDRDNKARW